MSSSEAGPSRQLRTRSRAHHDEEILDRVIVTQPQPPQPQAQQLTQDALAPADQVSQALAPQPQALAPQNQAPAPQPQAQAALAIAPQAAVPLPVHRDFRSSIKIEKLAILEGSKNYDLWSQQMLIWDALDATQVVVNGHKPPVNSSAAELVHHKYIETESLLLLIQVVSQQILLQISRHRSAHLIWQYLRKMYQKDTPLSFVHEIHAFNSLSSTLDTTQPISEFIDSFEIRWMHLHTLTSNAHPGSFKATYRTLLELEEAKREYLLASVVTHYPNVVDNLTTKENLSYDDLKERLVGLAINNQLSSYNGGNQTNMALLANGRPNKARRKKFAQSQQQATKSQSQQAS